MSPTPSHRSGRKHRPLRIVGAVVLSTLVGLAAVGAAPAEAATKRKVRTVGPDFNIVISPDSQRVGGGQRAVFPVFIQAVRGFKSTPSFDIDGVPGYIDAEIAKLGTNRFQLELIVPPNAPSTNGVYRLYAKSGSRERTALFRLEVVGVTTTQPPVTAPPVTAAPATNPPVTQPPAVVPQFNLRADVSERSAITGETTQFGMTVERLAGWQGPVSFGLSGAPNGASANFAPNPTTASTNLYITAGTNTPTGRYVMTVTATAGSTQRVALIAWNVTASGDFALLATPTTRTLSSAGSTTYKFDIGTANNIKPSVSFDVAGLPAGATARWSANPATASTTLTVTALSTTPVGTYNLIVTGRSGVYSRQSVVQLVVQNTAPGFGLEATPGNLAVTRNGRNALVVNIKPFGGFKGTVALSASGLPAGVRVTNGGSSTTATTLLFDADTTAQPGSYKVTITGTSGALSAAVEVALTVL